MSALISNFSLKTARLQHTVVPSAQRLHPSSFVGAEGVVRDKGGICVAKRDSIIIPCLIDVPYLTRRWWPLAGHALVSASSPPEIESPKPRNIIHCFDETG
jgi:hypothetical protein